MVLFVQTKWKVEFYESLKNAFLFILFFKIKKQMKIVVENEMF